MNGWMDEWMYECLNAQDKKDSEQSQVLITRTAMQSCSSTMPQTESVLIFFFFFSNMIFHSFFFPSFHPSLCLELNPERDRNFKRRKRKPQRQPMISFVLSVRSPHVQGMYCLLSSIRFSFRSFFFLFLFVFRFVSIPSFR